VAAVQHSLKESGSGVEQGPHRGTERAPDTDIAPLPAWETVAEVTPPKIPDFETAPNLTSKAEAHWDRASDPPFPTGILHPHRTGHRGQRRPSRTVITMSVLACVVVVFLAATAIITSQHQPTTTGSGPPAASTPTAPTPAATTAARSATEAALTATTTAQQRLESLSGIPTITKVTAVMTPYISSLQRYQSFLARSKVPALARGARNNAATVVSQDLLFLGTIRGLESLRLGTYLVQFGSNTVELQTTLSTFEQIMRSSANLR
jgi:hypothetical protein